MEAIRDRFLRYARINTTSDEKSDACPSSEAQWALARLLHEELRTMGVSDAHLDAHGYVYGILPANCEGAPVIGLIAHMDTVDAVPGRAFQPRALRYEGGDIILNADKGVVLRTADFPELSARAGEELIITDGQTVLGADDKAGVAEIMTLCDRLLAHPEIKHGRICVGFTPDEEIGRGANLFDVAGFGADFAYTVDGGAVNELEYENFNAAAARITVRGRNIHPGTAKNRMKHAARMAMAFNAMLPENEKPEYTEGYEGFYHLCEMAGDEENARLVYILRDHDAKKLEEKKTFILRAAAYMNARYGEGTFTADIRDSYRNMREMIEPHMEIIHRAEDAIRAEGLAPRCVAIRGGTDGARLSFMGLPCPNLGTGSFNHHGIYEYASVRDMETMVNILQHIVTAR